MNKLAIILGVFSLVGTAWGIPKGDCPKLVKVSESKITNASLSKDIRENGYKCEWFQSKERCDAYRVSMTEQERILRERDLDEVELLNAINGFLVFSSQDEKNVCHYNLYGEARVERYERKTGKLIELVKSLELKGHADMFEGAKNATLRIRPDFGPSTGIYNWDEYYVLRVRRIDGGLDTTTFGPRIVQMTSYQYESNDFSLDAFNTSANSVEINIIDLEIENLEQPRETTGIFPYDEMEDAVRSALGFGSTLGISRRRSERFVVQEWKDKTTGEVVAGVIRFEVPVVESLFKDGEYSSSTLHNVTCNAMGIAYKNYLGKIASNLFLIESSVSCYK